MFAERLKELRKAHRITQEQLASIIGVERSSIGKYEGRSRTIPSDDIKYKIAEFFGVSVDYLLGYTDTPTPVDPKQMSKDENDLILMFRELTPAGQGLVMDYVQMLLSKSDYRQDEPAQLAT